MDMVRLYHRCDMGMAGFVWPDGRAYLDQPERLIRALDIVRDEWNRTKPQP